jgi:alpha-L-rhamnosidase
MMGSIDAWFYKYVAGIQIDPEHPGFESFIIKPVFPEGLPYANAKVGTIKGEISVSWKKQDGILVLNAQIPFNTSAKIYIPGKRSSELTESGKNVKNLPEIRYSGYVDGAHVIKVPSGNYQFSINQD